MKSYFVTYMDLIHTLSHIVKLEIIFIYKTIYNLLYLDNIS